MKRNGNPGIPHPGLPNLAQLQQRRAALLGFEPSAASSPNTVPSGHAPLPVRRLDRSGGTGRQPFDAPHLSHAAFSGVAGEAIRALAPNTEAHPAALLLQLLAAFGNLLGQGPHCIVNATRHHLNLFVVLVGDSSKARKGTSWRQLSSLFAEVDLPWLTTGVTHGHLTTRSLSEATCSRQPVTSPITQHPVPTENDCRLLAVSEEFAAVLRGFKRGPTLLSPMLRSVWDDGHLPATNLNAPAQQLHLSVIAHITRQELAQSLHHTEAENGFANRCLWTIVHRTQCLPEGGNPDPAELSAIARQLRHALACANNRSETLFHRNRAATELWRDRYPVLSQLSPGLPSALAGRATSRAEAQVLRLSALYAALDATNEITLPHLEAALAVWDYCYQSASLLFGMATGNPIADRIREAIEATPTGLSQYQIRRLFNGHIDTQRIQASLQQLVAAGALTYCSQPTGGRPSTIWSAPPAEEAGSDDNPEASHASEALPGERKSTTTQPHRDL